MRTHGVFGVFPTWALTEVVGRTLYPKSDWAKAAHREFARRAVSGQVRSSHMRRLIVQSGVMNPEWIEPHARAWDPLAGWGYSKHRHIAFEHLDMRIEFDFGSFDVPIRVPGSPSQVP